MIVATWAKANGARPGALRRSALLQGSQERHQIDKLLFGQLFLQPFGHRAQRRSFLLLDFGPRNRMLLGQVIDQRDGLVRFRYFYSGEDLAALQPYDDGAETGGNRATGVEDRFGDVNPGKT